MCTKPTPTTSAMICSLRTEARIRSEAPKALKGVDILMDRKGKWELLSSH